MQQTGVSDHRTQIYLPEHLYTQVKEHAKRQKISMAMVIRDAVTERFAYGEGKKKKKSHNDLMELAGSIKGGPTDISTNISKYIRQMYREKYP